MQRSRDVQFRFSKPNGSPAPEPSRAMTEALRRLSESDEMKPLLSKAQAAGRRVLIEVFHGKEGHPLLIHTAVLP